MAKKDFFVHINFNKNQAMSFVLENLSSAPDDPVVGQCYYDTVSDMAYFWDGSGWVEMASSGSVDFPSLAGGVSTNETFTVGNDSIISYSGNGIVDANRIGGIDIDTTSPVDGDVIMYSSGSGGSLILVPSSNIGVTDHGDLDGLDSDDHSQYIILTPSLSSRNIIQPTVADVIPLSIRQSSGTFSSAHNVFQVQTNGGTDIFSVYRSAASTYAVRFNTNVGSGTLGYIRMDSNSGRTTGFINTSSSSNANGGSLVLSAGSGSGSTGGTITSSGGTTGRGGNITLSGSSGVRGGDISLIAGATSTSAGGGGGDIYLEGGDGSSGGVGGSSGSINLGGGDASVTHAGGAGGSITMQGSNSSTGSSGASGGSINTSAVSTAAGGNIYTYAGSFSATSGGSGGSLSAYGGSGGTGSAGGAAGSLLIYGGSGSSSTGAAGAGGSIISYGGASGSASTTGGGAGGSLTMIGGAGGSSLSASGGRGGNITTSGSAGTTVAGARGGDINTSASGATSGGDITTSAGGGSILTNSATASYIQLGTSSNRVSITTSSPASALTHTLANVSGTTLVTADGSVTAGEFAVSNSTTLGDITFRAIQSSDLPNGSGTPEGSVTATVGSIYLNTSASHNEDVLYTKGSGSGNTGWNAVGGRGISTLTARTMITYFSDYTIVTSVQGPFLRVVTNTGSATTPTTGVVGINHIGVEKFISSSTANSGGGSLFSVSQIILGGHEVYEGVFYTPASFASRTFKCGFINSTTSADESDGAYFRYSESGDVIARTSSFATGLTTDSSTITTLSISTWYTFRIVVNSDATSIAFSIYDDAGTQVGSTATITDDIPLDPVSCGFFTTHSTGAASGELVHVDFQSFSIRNRILQRGPTT